MPLVIPNFHVALIHFPIALLVLGVAIELVCSFAWKTSGARLAARWMILLGTLFGWPAAYSGAFAIRTAAGEDFAALSWADIRGNSPTLSNEGAWEVLRTHLVINAGAVALCSLVVVGWLMAGARLRQKLHVPGMALLVLACSAVMVAAWHGGELVYFHDVTHVRDSTGINATGERVVSHAPRDIVPPLDAHVTLAGLATGIALIAWGVAARSRRAMVAVDPNTGQTLPGTTAASPDSPLMDPQRDRIFAAFQQNSIEVVTAPPQATLGWIAAFAFLAVSGLGLWSLADSFESWSPALLMEQIIDAKESTGLSRRLAHLLAGVAVLMLSLLVGIVGARSRSRTVPMLVGFVLFAALAVQAWIGILLLLDTNSGALTRLNG
jgi:uncharacterized membrane protein